MKEVNMPKMGITMTSATITKWHVAVGDMAQQGEKLYDIETDKSEITVESPFTGKLVEIVVPEGESADVDALIAKIEE